MRIEFIHFKGFPPFADQRVSFPRTDDSSVGEVHVITGENGTGKTRLLSGVAAACGNKADLEKRQTVGVDSNVYVGLLHTN